MKQETIINRLDDIKELMRRDYADKEKITTRLEQLMNELKLDTIDTYKVGKFNVNAYFKRIIKNVPEYRPVFKNVHKQNNGKFGLCDGYIYIQFEDEDDKIAKALYNSENDDMFIQYENIITEGTKKLVIDMNYLQKLIAYNKVNKHRNIDCIPYVDGNENGVAIGFNPVWLMELLQLNNTNEITLGKDIYAPVQIKSEKYSCMLCPVRLTQNQTRTDIALSLREKFLKESEE